jgi:hypothetical protein
LACVRAAKSLPNFLRHEILYSKPTSYYFALQALISSELG